MANVTFILKEPLSHGLTLVYLIYRFNNQRLKYSSGQRINPKFWNPEKQRAKETRQFPEYQEFNAYLNHLENKTHTIYRKSINDGLDPSPEMLRLSLNEIMFKSKASTKKDLLLFVSEWIAQSTKKPGTVKHYRQTLSRLKEFKSATRAPLTFESIDLIFYNSFVRFCTDQNYGINTIGGYIKDIKTFMGEALDRKLTINSEFKNKKFKKLFEDTDTVYLTIAELDSIYRLDLTAIPRLDRVRDLFIVGCYTGLRFSDLVQINDKNIIQNGTQIKMRTEKTGSTVVIPLHSRIRNIITKYGGNLPTDISNQKMNDYLKEIGELAQIQEQVILTATKGGTKEKTVHKKHELITVHTARRSFATNAFLMQIPSISIMKITGHKTERAFMTYIKMSEEENANTLLSHPFFN